jgi:uncharacterized protein
MTKRETRGLQAAQLETRQLNGVLQVGGYAIRFNEPADSGQGWAEVCDPQMLTRTLRENSDVRLLREHDPSKLLARTKPGTLNLTVDTQGLRFIATMQPTDIAADTYQNLKAGNLDGCSFGFNCVRDEWSTTADGTPLRRLLDVDLYEISICSWPFYNTTSADARSRAAQMSKRDDDDEDCDPTTDPDCDPDNLDGDEDDQDDDNGDEEMCSCRCERCLNNRCERCIRSECDSLACYTRGCAMPGQDDNRADALRLNQYFASAQANL